MTLTARDKKLVMVLVPIVAIAAYWMLILSPQRSELSKLDQELSQVETARDDAQNRAGALAQSKTEYARDYSTVVRLGKAIPASLDMPSLLVQLDDAAEGTGIDFDSITAGARQSAAANAAGSGQAGGASGSSQPVDAGGAQAQSTPGKPVEQANEASKTSDQANQAAGASTGASGAAAAGGSGVAGLDSVPLNFAFNGGYFKLADFLHRVKRFVRVANKDLAVRGRLMTIDGVTLTSSEFPTVSAQITATVYLAPKTQGTSAGATPAGPATPASTQTPTPAQSTGSQSAPTSTPGSGETR